MAPNSDCTERRRPAFLLGLACGNKRSSIILVMGSGKVISNSAFLVLSHLGLLFSSTSGFPLTLSSFLFFSSFANGTGLTLTPSYSGFMRALARSCATTLSQTI
ncbi:hypothetical protein BC827DRAFT_1221004 [Russula dissimulans]|nr:hypothetical protein BC827DRAFT_1221004 [Russula dissimulans]